MPQVLQSYQLVEASNRQHSSPAVLDLTSDLRFTMMGAWRGGRATGGRRWEVIVEPSPADEVLIVVTAYPVD
jgi:hypothetical protein